MLRVLRDDFEPSREELIFRQKEQRLYGLPVLSMFSLLKKQFPAIHNF